MASVHVIPIGADFDIFYSRARDRSDNYLNSGTCTYALKEVDSDGVIGDTLGTGTCSYVSASNGNYLGVIESTVTDDLTHGARYVIEITFSKDGYNDFRRMQCRAEYREEV